MFPVVTAARRPPRDHCRAAPLAAAIAVVVVALAAPDASPDPAIARAAQATATLVGTVQAPRGIVVGDATVVVAWRFA